MNLPLWTPDTKSMASSHMASFMRTAARERGITPPDYAALYDWSVGKLAEFWEQIWHYCGVIGERADETVLVDAERMPGARWFPAARLNFAENLLRRRDGTPAILF